MVSSKGTKRDVICLQRKNGALRRPKASRKSPAIRKLVIRLLPGLNEHLRAEMRYRGTCNP